MIAEPACAARRNAFGPPDAGNLHVRWDEGGGSLAILLYSTVSHRFPNEEHFKISSRRWAPPLSGSVSQIGGEPAFDLCDGHSLARSVVLDLISCDSIDTEIS